MGSSSFQRLKIGYNKKVANSWREVKVVVFNELQPGDVIKIAWDTKTIELMVKNRPDRYAVPFGIQERIHLRDVKAPEQESVLLCTVSKGRHPELMLCREQKLSSGEDELGVRLTLDGLLEPCMATSELIPLFWQGSGPKIHQRFYVTSDGSLLLGEQHAGEDSIRYFTVREVEPNITLVRVR